MEAQTWHQRLLQHESIEALKHRVYRRVTISKMLQASLGKGVP